ncbi:MAG: hypothetical protein GY870_12820 [archaeon]|nr:hypothetical protein [archaeon]
MRAKINKIILSTSIIISLLLLFPSIDHTENIQDVKYNTKNIDVFRLCSSAIENENISGISDVSRVEDVMHLSINLTGSSELPFDNNINVTIGYTNGTAINYTISNTTWYIWELDFTPEANAPLGNTSLNITFNDGSDFQYSENKYFRILNSLPSIGVELSEKSIYRNNTLYFNVTPSDAEDSYADLSWEIELWDSGGIIDDTNFLARQLENYNYTFNTTSYNLGDCYVWANVTDKENNSTITTTHFTLLNNAPIIDWLDIEISDSETTDPDADEILRGTGVMNIKLNYTDVDIDDCDLEVKAIAVADNTVINFPDVIDTSSEADFSISISISNYQPAGVYSLYLTVYEDTDNTINVTQTYDFTVINNLPNASLIDFTLNGETPNSVLGGIKIQEYSEQMLFHINVTSCDKEGIDYIKICLRSSDGEWLNFTFENNNGSILDYNMRARDLPAGQWIAYIYVIDSDGAEIGTNSPISFDILADNFTDIIPWIFLFIGVLIGVGLAASFLGSRFFSLRRDYNAIIGSELTPKSSKNRKSVQKQKDSSKKPSKKPDISEKKKSQKRKIPDEIEKKDENTSEEKESTSNKKKRQMMRKIK